MQPFLSAVTIPVVVVIVCSGGVCAVMPVWGSEEDFVESVLCFYLDVGARD